jgi:hypothetical protein
MVLTFVLGIMYKRYDMWAGVCAPRHISGPTASSNVASLEMLPTLALERESVSVVDATFMLL